MNPQDSSSQNKNTEDKKTDVEKAAEAKPPKKKLSLEIEGLSETMTRLERKISP